MPTIFLDIDGVLNDTPITVCGPLILPRCAEAVQELVAATGAHVVITSSWRKWIADGSMTTLGFERMLWTHGIRATVRGYLPIGHAALRDLAIRRYVEQHGIERWVVLDDMAMALDNFVRTDGERGMTAANLVDAYRILRDGTCKS